jgi:hypothetical protein
MILHTEYAAAITPGLDMCTGGTGTFSAEGRSGHAPCGFVLGQRGQLRAKDLCYSLTS